MQGQTHAMPRSHRSRQARGHLKHVVRGGGEDGQAGACMYHSTQQASSSGREPMVQASPPTTPTNTVPGRRTAELAEHADRWQPRHRRRTAHKAPRSGPHERGFFGGGALPGA